MMCSNKSTKYRELTFEGNLVKIRLKRKGSYTLMRSLSTNQEEDQKPQSQSQEQYWMTCPNHNQCS